VSAGWFCAGAINAKLAARKSMTGSLAQLAPRLAWVGKQTALVGLPGCGCWSGFLPFNFMILSFL
jgi:hypothetical protein